jgi:autotransporter-associated beta strand protein
MVVLRSFLPAAAFGLFTGVALHGQTTIEYGEFENNPAHYSTDAPNDPLTLEVATGPAEQSGTLSGTGGVIKTGGGSLTLSASNSYSGGTTLEAGTLRIGDLDALGTGAVLVHGGTLGNVSAEGNLGTENAFVASADFGIDVQGEGNVLDFFGTFDMGTGRTVTFTSDGIACFENTVSGHNITFVTGGSPALVTFCSIESNTFTGTLRLGTGISLELWKQGDYDDPPVIAISGDLQIDEGATAILVIRDQFAADSNVEVNGTLLGEASGTNAINALTGSGLITDFTEGTLAVNSGTFTGTITETQAILKQGAGLLRLTGSSSYTGGTSIASGTLQAGNNHALGQGSVFVAGGAVLWVEENVALTGTGTVTLENVNTAIYRKDFAAAESFAHFGTITSDSVDATTARLLGGSASAPTSTEASFSDQPSAPASNDAYRISDVFSLEGISGETFVLQLSYTQDAYEAAALAGLYTSETQLLLGRLEDGAWVAAGSGPAVLGAWSGQLAVGTYGVDVANNVVWVVTAQTGEFAVVPEPAATTLLAFALATAMSRRFVRRREGGQPGPHRPNRQG